MCWIDPDALSSLPIDWRTGDTSFASSLQFISRIRYEYHCGTCDTGNRQSDLASNNSHVSSTFLVGIHSGDCQSEKGTQMKMMKQWGHFLLCFSSLPIFFFGKKPCFLLVTGSFVDLISNKSALYIHLFWSIEWSTVSTDLSVSNESHRCHAREESLAKHDQLQMRDTNKYACWIMDWDEIFPQMRNYSYDLSAHNSTGTCSYIRDFYLLVS